MERKQRANPLAAIIRSQLLQYPNDKWLKSFHRWEQLSPIKMWRLSRRLPEKLKASVIKLMNLIRHYLDNHSIRNSLIMMVAIPTSLVCAFIGMWLFGYSLNMITWLSLSVLLGGICSNHRSGSNIYCT
jgi:hypothetical protein